VKIFQLLNPAEAVTESPRKSGCENRCDKEKISVPRARISQVSKGASLADELNARSARSVEHTPVTQVSHLQGSKLA
jgi:hypothetical protein